MSRPPVLLEKDKSCVTFAVGCASTTLGGNVEAGGGGNVIAVDRANYRVSSKYISSKYVYVKLNSRMNM